FEVVVSRIWDPSGRSDVLGFYLRLYSYFVLATLGMLCTLTPWTYRLLGVGWWTGWVGRGLAAVNLAVYLAMGTCVVAIFWRTNYRVRTVKDLGKGGGGWGDRVGVLGF
ncbi:hypothetical protein TrRE_jg1747, partial [Triparma retinervis]